MSPNPNIWRKLSFVYFLLWRVQPKSDVFRVLFPEEVKLSSNLGGKKEGKDESLKLISVLFC